jgi:peroxiredoxin
MQTALSSNGVQFVGIAADSADRVRDFAKDMGINYPLAVGGLEVIDLAKESGDPQGLLPYSLVLDRAGVVAATKLGVFRPEQLQDVLKKLL